MARRDPSLLEVLLVFPWWFSVLLSLAAYVSLAHILPALTADNPYSSMVGQAMSRFAGFVAFILLLPAPFSYLRQRKGRQLLAAQSRGEGLGALSWSEFEMLLAAYYRREGYQVLENVGAGADGGVDLRLRKDNELHLVQCKHWQSKKVGVAVVREMYGVLADSRATSMTIVASGDFTVEAKTFARGKPITLVDGASLRKRLVHIRQSPSYQALKASKPYQHLQQCPRCKSPLVKRIAKRGDNMGNAFMGCSRFPQCRHTQPIPTQ